MLSAHDRIDAPRHDNHFTDAADYRVLAAGTRQHKDLEGDTPDPRLQRLDLAPQPALVEHHHQRRYLRRTPPHEPEHLSWW